MCIFKVVSGYRGLGVCSLILGVCLYCALCMHMVSWCLDTMGEVFVHYQMVIGYSQVGVCDLPCGVML